MSLASPVEWHAAERAATIARLRRLDDRLSDMRGRATARPAAPALPAERLGGETAPERIGQRFRGARIQRQQGRARIAAVAPHGAERRLEVRGAARLHGLAQARDLLLHGARVEQVARAAAIVKPA